jgi:hypothetical protein
MGLARAAFAEFRGGTRQLQGARELRAVEIRKNQRDREGPRLRAEQRFVQIWIERGELLCGRHLGQIGVRPEPLEGTVLRRLGAHGDDHSIAERVEGPEASGGQNRAPTRERRANVRSSAP